MTPAQCGVVVGVVRCPDPDGHHPYQPPAELCRCCCKPATRRVGSDLATCDDCDDNCRAPGPIDKNWYHFSISRPAEPSEGPRWRAMESYSADELHDPEFLSWWNSDGLPDGNDEEFCFARLAWVVSAERLRARLQRALELLDECAAHLGYVGCHDNEAVDGMAKSAEFSEDCTRFLTDVQYNPSEGVERRLRELYAVASLERERLAAALVETSADRDRLRGLLAEIRTATNDKTLYAESSKAVLTTLRAILDI